MKTLRVWILTAMVLLPFLSAQAVTSTDPARRDSTREITESAEARVIIARLGEIKAMDKSNLSASEIDDLEKEVKKSERRMRQIGGGVFSSYFSRVIYRFTVAMRF